MTFLPSLMYVEIVIVCGGPMFVACKRINIPPKVFIYEIELATNKITSPRTGNILATHEH